LSTELTRAKFLKGAAGAAGIAAAGFLFVGCDPLKRSSNPQAEGSPEGTHKQRDASAPSAPPPLVQSFRSRPDLQPPTIEVRTHSSSSQEASSQEGGSSTYIFVAPKNGPDEKSPSQDGAMILDARGDLLWFWPLEAEEHDVMDFKVQSYRGEDVLTFWVGPHTGYGKGEYLILDSSYEEVGRVRAANGYQGDHHEFLITPQNTALITIYGEVEGFDLSSLGGSKEGKVLDGIVQEIDIQTGELLFEWHSLEHVALEESYGKVPKESQKWYFDYFHINSIEVDHDGNLLLSARKTSTIYKIDRTSGEVLWRLGGKKSDFEMASGATTAYQHDARRQQDGTITVFDNGDIEKDDQSYGLVLEVDEENMSAKLLREYPNPEGKLCATQGSMQVVPQSQTVFIGWGSNPLFSEYSREGQMLISGSFPEEVETYRAFRFPWKGQPTQERPTLAAERVVISEGEEEGGAGQQEVVVRVYASWNGATEVASWEVVWGTDPSRMAPVGEWVEKEGFETAIEVRGDHPWVGVRARDASGRVLAASKAIKPGI